MALGGAGQFRSHVWDPILLIAQLVAMQGLFYASLCLLVVVVDGLSGGTRSLAQIFRYQSFFLRDSPGRRLFVAQMLNCASFAGGLWLVVGRAKLCLDFAASAHLIHLILSAVYNGAFPVYGSWWLLQLLSLAVSTVLGEYLCMQSEIRAVPITAYASAPSDL